MHKAFQYRLRPTAKQATTLVAVHLKECRMLYNHFVVDRIQTYKDRGHPLAATIRSIGCPFSRRKPDSAVSQTLKEAFLALRQAAESDE